MVRDDERLRLHGGVDDDVDVCFRFIVQLSRRLGHVQFFQANRISRHHAWVQAEAGRVIRAYAWAGKTLWNQGPKSLAERELGFGCCQYAEETDQVCFGELDIFSINTERVPLLAARWSLDPASIDGRSIEQMSGVAGEPSKLY